MAAEEKKFLGTAGVERLITNIRAEIAEGDSQTLIDAQAYADGLADNYDAAGTAATKVQELANGQVKTNTEAIGTLDDLDTTAKGDLVNAINEVRNAVSAGGTAAAVTMTENAGSGSTLKSYTIKQGDATVGTIDIPKDMVVQSGSVVVNPEGQEAGTYIKLVLANATNDEIYVNVGTLVDVYKAKANATQIQLAIDSATREISATVVAGSITSTELAANAVVTAKIADGNVTKAKLSTEVQASLDKADGAAADAQSKADAALEAAKEYADQAETDAVATAATDAKNKADAALASAKTHANDLNSAMDTRVKVVEGKAHEHANKTVLDDITSEKVTAWDAAEANAIAAAAADATTKANDALADAKEYSDGQNTAMDTRMKVVEGKAHEHSNKALLDTYTQTEVNLADAVAKKHNHANKTVLDGITADNVSAWSAAEGNAKTHANNLNSAMNTRVEALEAVSYVEITADEVDAMFNV